MKVLLQDRISISAAAVLGLSSGLVGGALFGFLDVVNSPAWSSESSAILMMAMTAGVCGIVSCLLCIALGAVCRWILPIVPARAFAALVWGIAIQLPLASSLAGTRAAITAAVPWIVAWIWYSRFDAARKMRALSQSIAISLFFMLVAAAMLRFGPGDVGNFTFLFATTALSAAVVGIARAVHRSPWVAQTVLLIPVCLIIVFVRGSKGWVDNEIPKPVPSSQPVHSKPNIIVIVLDTTRFDYLGCYGNKLGLTPRLDALAAESTIYSDCFTTGPWTVPSHASLFTGYYTPTHGCDNEPHRWLDEGFQTLPEMLAPHGYESVAFVANNYVEETNQLQGFDQYQMLAAGRKASRVCTWIRQLGLPASWADHGAAEGRDSIREWLTHDRNPKKPFCMFVNLLEAHWPHNAPLPERTRYLPPGVSYADALAVSAKYYGIRWLAGQPHSPRDERILRGIYAAEVAYQDRILGEMLDAMTAQLDMKNTLLIVTADHGENLGEAGRWDHMFALNDYLVHVPLIIKYPENIGRGQRIAGLCQMVDLVPTVFDVMGGAPPVADLPGKSLLPQKFQPYKYVYAQASPYYGHLERMEAIRGFQKDVHQFSAELHSIRDDRYKLVVSSHGNMELFDIQADPAEEHDIAGMHADIVMQMSAELKKWTAAQPPYTPRPGQSHRKPRSQRDSLRNLGYVQ